MTEELKPCPFCGKEAKITTDKTGCYSTGCEWCNIWINGCCNSLEMQSSFWNNRPIEEALRSENERLTKELEEIKFALQVEEHDNEYSCNKIDKLEAENARLKGLYGIIDGQKIIIKELEDKVVESSESCPTGAIEVESSESN